MDRVDLLYNDIKVNFCEFLIIFRNKTKNRCLLIGLKNNSLYITISGINDFDSYENLHNEFNMLLENLGLNKDNNLKIEYVKFSDKVLYRKKIINPLNEKKIIYENFSQIEESDKEKRRRDFSCTERKLLAYLGNNITEIENFKFIVCRYLPCRMCYWVIEGLTNFYVFDSGDCFRIVIQKKICFINIDLNDSQKLVLLLHDNYRDRNDVFLCFGENYIYIKERQ